MSDIDKTLIKDYLAKKDASDKAQSTYFDAKQVLVEHLLKTGNIHLLRIDISLARLNRYA